MVVEIISLWLAFLFGGVNSSVLTATFFFLNVLE